MQLKTDSGDFVHMTTCKHYNNIIICCPVRPGSTWYVQLNVNKAICLIRVRFPHFTEVDQYVSHLCLKMFNEFIMHVSDVCT